MALPIPAFPKLRIIKGSLLDLASLLPSYGWIIIHSMGIPHFHFPSIDECFWIFTTFWLLWIPLWTSVFTFFCVDGLFWAPRYIPRSGTPEPKISRFSFVLVIWSKQMFRYKIGNWHSEYCSRLQLKNWATLLFSSFWRGRLDLCAFRGHRAWRQATADVNPFGAV